MTEVIKVDPENPDAEILRKAAEVIKRGGLVVFPTETVYGIGANAFNENACKKIFKAKGRPQDNPLIVHISSIDMLYDVVLSVPRIAYEFIDKLWPGPLTLIMEKKSNVPDVVSASLPTVAVRMPSHPVANLLIELSGHPIAAPSANLSGKPSPTSFEHVKDDMMGRVDVIIDAGETPLGIESTIIDLTKDPPVLLRPGPLTLEQISRISEIEVHKGALGKFSLDKPPSPGMKYRHYAPEKRLILVKSMDKMKSVLRNFNDPIVVCPKEHMEMYKGYKVLVLGSLEKEYSIAHELFKILRETDKMEGEVVIVEGFPEKGILFSVMNRLKKAASEVIE